MYSVYKFFKLVYPKKTIKQKRKIYLNNNLKYSS